jgi:hypothetical protein
MASMAIQPTVVGAFGSAQVILSHKTADASITAWVKAQVEAMGIRCWVAEDDPQPSILLSAKVQTAIAESAAMVVLLTEAAYASPYVQQEIGAATNAGLPIIALVEKSLMTNTLAMLAGVEVIYFDPQDLSSSSANLIVGLRHIAEKRAVRAQAAPIAVAPAFQFQLGVRVQLTPAQLVVGVILVGAIVGLAVYGTRNTGGPGSGPPGPGAAPIAP